MTHEIIDSKNAYVEQIKNVLSSTESARFAVEYFFLSGFTSLADELEHIT